MYRIKTYDFISGAHFLRNYHGKCENLHGHNWKIEVEFVGNQLNGTGMLIDFHDAKAMLKEVVNYLDHKNINEIPPFDKINPTAENIAKFIFDYLNNKINNKPYMVKKVAIWETEKNCAIYEEN